jgi:hypothetical protein
MTKKESFSDYIKYENIEPEIPQEKLQEEKPLNVWALVGHVLAVLEVTIAVRIIVRVVVVAIINY